MDATVDPRQAKTWARLAAAVLTLGSEKPIGDVTVSELAAAADVHRSTFYEWAASPAELLQAVLLRELDALRAPLVGATPANSADAVTEVTAAVLRHVDAHDVIYTRGLGEGSGSASLHAFLSAHFRGSIELLFDQGTVVVPSESSLDRNTVAAYIADGTVGAIEVWLRSAKPRDAGLVLRRLGELAPAWWPVRG